jgi:hypothetical protein
MLRPSGCHDTERTGPPCVSMQHTGSAGWALRSRLARAASSAEDGAAAVAGSSPVNCSGYSAGSEGCSPTLAGMAAGATRPAASAARSAATDSRRMTGAPHRTQTSVASALSAPHSTHLILHRPARLPIVAAADPDASDHGSLWRLSADFRKRKWHGRAAQAADGVRAAVAVAPRPGACAAGAASATAAIGGIPASSSQAATAAL